MASPSGASMGTSRSITDVKMRKLYPMAGWGTRVDDDTGQEVPYFGRVGVPTKLLLISVPCVRQMMSMLMDITGTFFTDDYPRVPLSSITIFGALNTFFDIWVDPAIARWSDGLRQGVFGCGPFCGRRLPFYILGGMAYMSFSILLVSPPMELSEYPSEGTGPGFHRHWRVTTSGPGGGQAPWAVEQAQFFATGYISDDTRVACAADPNPSAVSAGAVCDLDEAAEVLNVRALIPASGESASVLLQYSDDGAQWKTAFEKAHVEPDAGRQSWEAFSYHYTSRASGIWYGVNYVLATSVAMSLFEVPAYAFRQEITPDLAERSVLFSWFGAAEGGAFAGAIVIGIAIQAVFGNTCASSPQNGCNLFFPWSVATAALFMAAATVLACRAKERPVEALPAEEATSSLCETVVTTIINRPWRVMLLSELAEAVGKAMRSQAVYWYFCKYVLLDRQVEAVLGIDYLTQAGARELISNIISIPFYAVWSSAGKRHGVYRVFMFQNVIASIWLLVLIAVLAIPCTPVARYFLHLCWNVVDAIIRAGYPQGQVLMNGIIDYDEFLTGQRREAQLCVMKPFFEKFAILPSTTVPLVLMMWFSHIQTGEKYDPTQSTQPSGVVWSLVLTRSLLPAIAFMVSAWFLRGFPMRHDAQHRELMRGLEAHRSGRAAPDPYYHGSPANSVEATVALEGSAEVRYGSHVLTTEHKSVLSHFFPSELQRVLAAGDMSALPRMLVVPLCVSSLLFSGGVALFFATFAAAQAADAGIASKLLCPLGTVMMSGGGAWLWFSVKRYSKAREALSRGVSLAEVGAQLAMCLPFVEGVAVASPEDDAAGILPCDDQGLDSCSETESTASAG